MMMMRAHCSARDAEMMHGVVIAKSQYAEKAERTDAIRHAYIGRVCRAYHDPRPFR